MSTRSAFTVRRRLLLLVLGWGCLLAPGAWAQPEVDGTGFIVEVQPPSSAALVPVAEWVNRLQLLTNLADALNKTVALPRAVALVSQECGVQNAFYHPAAHSVTICYELIDDVFDEFAYEGMEEAERERAVLGAVVFFILHEVGHAFVGELDLPVTGREEDVADQLATLFLVGESSSAAYYAAEYFRQMDDFGDMGLFKGIFGGSSRFADEHSLDEQRFYNVLCWTYGADPERNASLLAVVPEARAARCPGEYAQMKSAWERLLAGHGRTAQADAQGAPAGAADPAGVWSFQEHFEDEAGLVSCTNFGTLTLQRDGALLSGHFVQQGLCFQQGAMADSSGEAAIDGGGVSGTTVRLQAGNCTYEGTLAPSTLGGSVSCAYTFDGQSVLANGTWEATR